MSFPFPHGGWTVTTCHWGRRVRVGILRNWNSSRFPVSTWLPDCFRNVSKGDRSQLSFCKAEWFAFPRVPKSPHPGQFNPKTVGPLPFYRVFGDFGALPSVRALLSKVGVRTPFHGKSLLWLGMIFTPTFQKFYDHGFLLALDYTRVFDCLDSNVTKELLLAFGWDSSLVQFLHTVWDKQNRFLCWNNHVHPTPLHGAAHPQGDPFGPLSWVCGFWMDLEALSKWSPRRDLLRPCI